MSDPTGDQSDALAPAYPAWPLPIGFPRSHVNAPTALAEYADMIGGLEESAEATVERFLQPYVAPPLLPMDLFAIAALLLDLSGAYHHVMPAPRTTSDKFRARAQRVLSVEHSELEFCQKLAEAWRRPFEQPIDMWQLPTSGEFISRRNELQPMIELWDELVGAHGAEQIFRQMDESESPPPWWRVALKLFIIADEAARDAGFLIDPTGGKSSAWFMQHLDESLISNAEATVKEEHLRAAERQGDAERFIDGVGAFPDSISTANTDVLCVLPKSRTTPVGCTLRSLSHHLALLPPQGVARARWTPLELRQNVGNDGEFNLLLVPFPFTIEASEFEPRTDYGSPESNWSSFQVRQSWLDAYGLRDGRRIVELKLGGMVQDLIARAKAKPFGASRIDAVVLPELALDHASFRTLAKAVQLANPDLRFVIAGLSNDARGRHGNFVGVAALPEGGYSETVREKHHRWRLEASQIQAYGLEGVLDVRRGWWEDIDLLSRRVDFTVFQSGSVLAAMICEDLARVDPCQELLRSVGPNLVIALLMDAPQLRTRWPARYATILAEDPGSSVLTLTSRGLIAHQQVIGRLPQGASGKAVIALWRDNYFGEPKEIECPFDAQGVWLKLHGKSVQDQSLDGRLDGTAIEWIYALHHPLELPNAQTYDAILGSEDAEMRRRTTPPTYP